MLFDVEPLDLFIVLHRRCAVSLNIKATWLEYYIGGGICRKSYRCSGKSFYNRFIQSALGSLFGKGARNYPYYEKKRTPWSAYFGALWHFARIVNQLEFDHIKNWLGNYKEYLIS